MDSTLAQGVLERIDLLAAKMGVGATELWSIWLATWWRPLLDAAIPAVIAVPMLLASRWLWSRYLASGEDRYGRQEEWAGGAVFTGVAGVICVTVAVGLAATALPYAIDHRLYAIDQLAKLLGRTP